MKPYTVYDQKTGRVTQVVYTSFEPLAADNQGVLPGEWSDRRYYIVDSVPVERPLIDLDEVVEFQFGKLPELPSNADVYVNGVKLNGIEETSSLPPGEYRLGVDPPFPTKGVESTMIIHPDPDPDTAPDTAPNQEEQNE